MIDQQSMNAPMPGAPQPHREEVQFGYQECRLAAWHYRAQASAEPTCLIMAHGFGATRHYGLAPYAERFQANGYACFVFDYRHFGDSEGQPRNLLSIEKQHQDWVSAVENCRSLGYKRIVLWGTSFSGGHVLHLASVLPQITAAIAQVPHTSGPATVAAVPFTQLLRVGAMGLADAILSLFGRRIYIKAFAPIGELGAMSTAGAYESLVKMLPTTPATKDGTPWKEYFDQNNRVTAFTLLTLMFYSPANGAAKIRCPVLLQAGRKDQTTPFAPAEFTARKIANCTFVAYDVDHFDVYLQNDFEITVSDQLNFLRRHVPIQAKFSDPQGQS